MNDQETAALLLARCSRRISAHEDIILSDIASNEHLDDKGEWLRATDRHLLEGLKTQFAADLK